MVDMTADENLPRQALTGEGPAGRRFLTVEQTAEELNVSETQIRAMLRSGELRGIQIGGRGLWRIGRSDIEEFIASAYERAAERRAAGELDDEEGGLD
jgi:excisionase family DNA binding protein